MHAEFDPRSNKDCENTASRSKSCGSIAGMMCQNRRAGRTTPYADCRVEVSAWIARDPAALEQCRLQSLERSPLVTGSQLLRFHRHCALNDPAFLGFLCIGLSLCIGSAMSGAPFPEQGNFYNAHQMVRLRDDRLFVLIAGMLGGTFLLRPLLMQSNPLHPAA
ncbi:hypothetical protein [Brucella pituitosa]|uniref:hypothetical protein n=1 Tax=Brucella pituitosa TaxID=571256 RepID=UPI001FFD883E|nr:hypothetical protein [Brucella pituitosa]